MLYSVKELTDSKTVLPEGNIYSSKVIQDKTFNVERLYYKVEELAEHWKVSIHDVIQLGLTGQLKFMAMVDWEYPDVQAKRIAPTHVRADNELPKICYEKQPFSDLGNVKFSDVPGVIPGDKCIITYYPDIGRLIIDASEVERFEIERNIEKANIKDVIKQNITKKPEQQKQSSENHYHFYKGDNVQEKKVAEINQSGSNMKLTLQEEQLIEVLKQISEGQDIFSPDSDEIEDLKKFQSIVRCLQEAEKRDFINKLPKPPISYRPESAGMTLHVLVIGGLTFKGEQVLNNPQLLNPKAVIDMSTTTINQNINNSTIHGSVLAAKTIENCLNTVQTSQADNGIKELLTDLLKQISELNSKVPAEKIQVVENMSRDAKSLVEEVSSNQPRKRNALFSLEGMKEAALQIGETAKPIIELAEKISPFLQILS